MIFFAICGIFNMATLKKLVIVSDLDNTLCSLKTPEQSYLEVSPYTDVINALNDIHSNGGEVIIDTARNMVTQNNDESKAIKNIGLDTLNWLKNNNVQYDGISFGKTCGTCYVDDKALRPKEFLSIYNSLKDKTDMKELQEKINLYLNTH